MGASGVDKNTPENSNNPILLWVVPFFGQFGALNDAFIALHIRVIMLMQTSAISFLPLIDIIVIIMLFNSWSIGRSRPVCEDVKL